MKTLLRILNLCFFVALGYWVTSPPGSWVPIPGLQALVIYLVIGYVAAIIDTRINGPKGPNKPRLG